MSNLPYPKFLKRREEGRCFHCGGPFAPGHRCTERSLRILLLVEDEENVGNEETVDLEVKTMELSACLADGMTPPKTMKLEGWIGGRRVVVLIDSGASHNFVNRALVGELKLPVTKTSPYPVSLGDRRKKFTQGRCDRIRLSLG